MKHQDLTGRGAIHPFAFVQDTDPADDAENGVTAKKAWIDTSGSNAILKVRNDANTAWLEVISGAVPAISVSPIFVDSVFLILAQSQSPVQGITYL